MNVDRLAQAPGARQGARGRTQRASAGTAEMSAAGPFQRAKAPSGDSGHTQWASVGARVLVALACALLASGCERQMHNMYQQPRYDPGEASPLWPDGRADRPPPPGTQAAAAGQIAGTSSARQGRDIPQQWQAASQAQSPPPITKTLLLRGQERFSIYCLPCHSAVGDGDGPVAQHGFPHPPTYHQERLRAAPDRYLFDVITQGHGVMASYADRVDAQDRWAIVAYIRALQLSQDAKVADLPPAVRQKVGP